MLPPPHLCRRRWCPARPPSWPQGLSASAVISFPIIRVPASTEAVNSAKAPPHSRSSLPPSLPLLPLSSSLPFPPRLHGSLGRCRLRPPPPHSPATAPSPWPLGKTPPYPGAPRNPVPLPHPSSCPSPRTPGLPAPGAPAPPENRGVLPKPPPLHWGPPFRAPFPSLPRSLPFPSPTPSFPSHPSPHPGPPCKSGVRRGEG